MARPKKFPEGSVVMSVRLSTTMAAKFAKEAKALGCSLSDVIEERLAGPATTAESHRSVEPARRNSGGSNPSASTCTHPREKQLPYAIVCADCQQRLR